MEITVGFAGREEALIDLFAATFSDSEGPEEGALVGDLTRDLLAHTPTTDIDVFCAEDDGAVIGAAVFTPLSFADDPRSVVLLSPMAVTGRRQRRGVGQGLINHALEALRARGVDVAITYGDPAYYARVGFQQITEQQARPPLPLSHPHGWLGRPLSQWDFPNLRGSSTCVSALNRPEIW
ncbi:N-acetyltransferase [Thalassobaculum sp. OXR-137]|uniref:GNAT family N-acetyltransferase n=1 Tax=Thalassobaculum sp. OXR-137 TaxID=3100173 RepID=UPI002AC8FD35|nr:N-acetyltransferase [Thalassobaculum sp. OXR-137]WPZ33009.1 N-acetyltransferase [Thalassobaculum sp. OXR-137]